MAEAGLLGEKNRDLDARIFDRYRTQAGLTPEERLQEAMLNKTDINQFICSDELLLKAAKSEGFEVFNPEKEFN